MARLPSAPNGPGVPVALVAIQNPQTGRYRLLPGTRAQVSAFDRSFHFGDSLYEVARTYHGILFALDEHVGRLERSLQLAQFSQVPDLAQLRAQVERTCRAFLAQHGDCELYVRTTISRGIGDLNIDRHSAGAPYALVFVKALGPVAAAGERPQRWVIASRRRNLVTALDPAMKSGNYLNSVLALAEAQALGADDALLLDHAGHATEGTTSNFFVVKGGEVWTAPLGVGILPGVTRAEVLETCRDLAVPVRELLMSADDVRVGDELFLSSSTREIQPIVALDGRIVGTGALGPLTARLGQRLRARIDAWCAAHRTQSLWQRAT